MGGISRAFARLGSILTCGLTIGTGKLAGRTTAGTGALEEIAIGSGLSMSAGTLSATGGGAVAAAWAKIANATVLALTGAASATLNRLHVVSGTSANYDITISGLTPATGDVLGFFVKDWTAASKQYRLDAGGTVKIAGRTRYLTLKHTNVVLLMWDGADWQPLVLDLATPPIHIEYKDTSGQVVTANTTNVVYGTLVSDDYSAFASPTFTCPVDGEYHIDASSGLNASTGAIGLYKGGALVRLGESSSSNVQMLSATIRCVAGDALTIRHTAGGTRSSVAAENYISITKVGP